MSIKDLFKNYQSNQFKPTESELSASKLVESNEYIEQKEIEKFRYVPPIDFTTASNFAKFGSAELYYEYAFKRIYDQYPYDGTLAEVQEFHNNSTFLDKYVFDNVYPRTAGHVIFSSEGWGSSTVTSEFGLPSVLQYISVFGGPHTASGGMIGEELSKTFDKSMVYDTSTKRGSSFEYTPVSGSTIEFWLNKSGYDKALTPREVILDIHNGQLSSSAGYGRIRLELDGSETAGASPIRLTMLSGTTGFEGLDICPSTFTTASVFDGSWHHYAVTMVNSGSDVLINLYQDGTFINSTTNSNQIGSIENVAGGVNAHIGALMTTPSGNVYHGASMVGAGKLSGSLDEFRYWKKARTTNEIGQFWFINLGGGTNAGEYNKDLGVYFKFNEGITTVSSTDSTILDYSGRIANGNFVGYTSSARSTVSAMETALTNVTEFKDPIIYSSHPTVSSSLTTYKASGSIDDYENTSLLYHLLPSWIAETDTENGKNVKYITQIMASYFDTLNAQINGVTQFKEKRYYSGSIKPNTYSREILRGQGFVVPDLFVDAEVIEEFRAKDVNETYTRDIQEVKNLIYQNIYNNLNYIYKSKGTEKSFRNLFRCFGVDSELLKLNLYSDGSTYLYKDNYEFTSVAKPVLNLNNENNLSATVYQSGSDGLTYLSSSEGDDEQFTSMTMECEFIMPYKFEKFETGYFTTDFLTASIAGFHRAKISDASDLTWHTSDTTLRMYAIRDELESKNVRFVLSGSSINLISSLYTNAYDNNKWILAARVKHSKHPYEGGLTGSVEASNGYILEFYGVNSEANEVKNEFTVSQALTNTVGKQMLGHAKRLFVGAHRTNYTGSVVEKSDVKVSQLRFWQSHVDDAEIREHSYDPMNYGLIHPYRSDAIFQVSGSETVYVPQIETLALHWDFMSVTASGGSGNFVVDDISSGSTTEATKYSMIGKITKNKYDGYGAFFTASSVEAVDKEFIYAARKKQPDIVYSSDGVVIKTDETEQFFQDDKVADHFYSFEKSPYGAVSDEMIKIFGSAKDFNSLIGDPVERYRVEYKQMKDLKTLFFLKVENTPDPEKYFEYFKWIDSSISYAIEQLIPASSRFAKNVKNVVESHALEKNKHQEKFPLVDRSTSTHGVVKSFSEISYKWKFGHAPIPAADNENCLWQRLRRRASNSATQNLRDNIYKTSNTELDTLHDFKTGQNYEGNTDAIRRLSRPYKLNINMDRNIHGGTNYYIAKNRNLVLDITKPHGPTNTLGIPINVLVAGVGVGQGLVAETICEDIEDPNHKEKYNFEGINGEHAANLSNDPVSDNVSYKHRVKGINGFPFVMLSQSSAVSTGYQSTVTSLFHESVYITNLHSDTVDISNEIPMQGPFTETHVGGHQSRHVRLNKYDTTLVTEGGGSPSNTIDDLYTRPEAWRLLFGENQLDASGNDGALGFVSSDYGIGLLTNIYPDGFKKRATMFRDEQAKRPLNVRNIRHNTASNLVGNYNKKYEVFSAAGRKENNLYFRKNSDISNYLPASLTGNLAHTTQIAGLFAAKSKHTNGNIFSGRTNRFSSETEAMQVSTPLLNNQKNESIITTRFSAPGGPEIQSMGYLDVYAREYSVHNALPFRNLSVKKDSGESGTIRVIDHLGNRRGLNSLLRQRSGRQGIEAEFAKRMVQFDGSDDVIHFSQNIGTDWEGLIGISGTRTMTFSFWVNLEEWSTAATIFSFRSSIVLQAYNQGSHTNTLIFNAIFSGTDGAWKIDSDSFNLNELTHVAISYQNAGTAFVPSIYINGEAATVTAVSTPTGAFSAMGSQPAGFGSVGADTSFKGSLAEFAIWSRILTAQEIKDIYSAGFIDSLTYLDAGENLQLWYKMGENHDSVNKIFDRSGNGKHSIVIGGTTLSEVPKIIYRDDSKPSYGKQNRNTRYYLVSGSSVSSPLLGENHDNMFISTPVPASDFQYSWINNTLKTEYDIYSGQQQHYGYSPENGIISSSAGYVEAINFPSSSNIT